MNHYAKEISRFRARLEDQRLNHVSAQIRAEKSRRQSLALYDEGRAFHATQRDRDRQSLAGGPFSLRRRNPK